MSVGTALVGGVAALLALVAWSSAILVHAGAHSAAHVGLLTGAFALGCVLLCLRSRVPRLSLDLGEAAGLALLGGLSAWLFFPAFPWPVADRDPGVYLAHAAYFARSGKFVMDDPVVDPSLGLPWANAFGERAVMTGTFDVEKLPRRFPGYWVQDPRGRRVVPQFFVLYPALLATAQAIFGEGGARAVNPCLGVASVLVAFVLLRRAYGAAAGGFGAALLAVNMIQVWHAKYATAEMISELLLLTAALGLVLGLEARMPLAAGLGGACLTLAFLARPDAILALLVAAAGLGVAAVLRLTGPTWIWFAGGLLAPLPHALLQAYGGSFAGSYGRLNGLPSFPLLAGSLAAAVLGTAVAWRSVTRLGPVHRVPPAAKRALLVLGMLLLAAGYLRALLFDPASVSGLRSYAEESLVRLTWFLTPLGMAALAVGFARLALGPWTLSRWAPVLTTVLLLPVFASDPRIQPGLMWWTRRFVPYTLPGMAALAGLGLALAGDALRDKRPVLGRLAAGAALAAVAVPCLGMSSALRAHREMAGAREMLSELGSLGGGRPALLLWYSTAGTESPQFCFGGPVWSYYGHASVSLPVDIHAGGVARFAAAFPGRPVYLVTGEPRVPEPLASLSFERIGSRSAAVPTWEETVSSRPARATTRELAFTIWRLGGRG